jgi:hypothetical protein
MGAPDLHLTSHPELTDAVGARSLAVSFAAEVISSDGGTLTVRAGAQRFAAQRALSCLVLPAAGDRVACWRVPDADGGDAVYIVAVLARAHAGLALQLAEGVVLDAQPGRLALRTGELEVQADSASFVYRTLQTMGELCSATFGQLKLVGGLLSTVFDSERRHAQQSHRVVEGLDRVDAKVIEQHAQDLLHLQAEHLAGTGERLVKFRGAQIHIG